MSEINVELVNLGLEADIGHFLTEQSQKVPDVLNHEELGHITFALNQIRTLILEATGAIVKKPQTLEEAQNQQSPKEVINKVCAEIADIIDRLPIRDQATKAGIMELTLRSIFQVMQSFDNLTQRLDRELQTARAARILSPEPARPRRGRPRKVKKAEG